MSIMRGGFGGGVSGYPSLGPEQEGAAPSVDGTTYHTVSQDIYVLLPYIG